MTNFNIKNLQKNKFIKKNYIHKEVNEMIIKAGKHIFSEKPLARSSIESASMLKLL